MSNCYTLVAAEELLACSKSDYQALKKIWEPEGYDEEGFELPSSGLELKMVDDQLFIVSEESGDESCIPDIALKKLGEIIQKAGKEYLEFGYANYCDRPLPGSRGGGSFRITAAGEIKHASTVWK